MTPGGVHRAWATAVLAVGLALTGVAAHFQQHANQRAAQTQFEAESARAVEAVVERLHLYEFGLRSVRGAVLAGGVDTLNRQRFLAYSASRDYPTEFPGARGFGVIRRVTPDAEAAFERRERRDGAPGFAVKQLSPHSGERFVIQYIEPLYNNRQALGLDVASERNRRRAALRSMHTGEATLTGPITLVQATGKPSQSFLLMLPIYRTGLPLRTEGERNRACVGWSYAPLVMGEVLKGLDLSDGDLTLQLADRGASEATVFFESPGDAAAKTRSLSQTIELSVFGRTWSATIEPTEAFFHKLNQTRPAQLAAYLAGVSVLLAALVYLGISGRTRQRQMHLAQAHRAAIVEHSPDAIIVESMDGRVVDWNTGAENMFGYLAHEAAGQLVGDLLLPPDRIDEDTAVLAALRRGQVIKPFETTARCKSGASWCGAFWRAWRWSTAGFLSRSIA